MKMHGRRKFKEMTFNDYRKPIEKRLYDNIKEAEANGDSKVTIPIDDASYIFEMLLYHYSINYKDKEFTI